MNKQATIREQIEEKSNFLVYEILFMNMCDRKTLTKTYQEKLDIAVEEKDYESAFKISVILEQIPIVCETHSIE